MPRNTLWVPLLDIAQGTDLNEYDLARMVDDEIGRLSAGARIHDYIPLIAIKQVGDKVRQSAAHNRTGSHRLASGG
ncbi:DUF3562 domain-containing protein [Paraburkholderia bryophila]|uniref:Uncharacterized protein n=1 Tax=Paraburkholderia bryophila TaxID=420952 RepID=A0A7Z0B3C2_9BURK|nr:DUF3562 domain-containing protein [Paraburkholderia bryophila]NYH19956.1 hypothetical protein [Paraburkholderia bryophila]